VVDSTWRLVQHSHHGQRWLVQGKPGAAEGGGDTVEDKYLGAALAHFLHDAGAIEDRQGERAVRKRNEVETSRMLRRQFSQTPMVEVAAGQSARVAERNQQSG
jgi:hypothetical protein